MRKRHGKFDNYFIILIIINPILAQNFILFAYMDLKLEISGSSATTFAMFETEAKLSNQQVS